jgi:CBS domain containing-hemolysin-like protein
LIVDRLGRAAEVGDVVQLGNVRLEVEEVARARVVSAIITLLDDADVREGTTP